MRNIMVTGAAGFIGAKVSEKLLNQGYNIIGIDNLNDYYDVRLKIWRLDKLKTFTNFTFYNIDIENLEALKIIFQLHNIDALINEAARAGVRYSVENPFVYFSTNAVGNLNLLELCKEYQVNKFILASTSSLYAGQPLPFKEELPVNTPVSPYAASKKAAEATAYSYHYLYGIDVSILRYFTVYGPAGRPDMSVFRFMKWIWEEKPLDVFGDGSQSRDFTYVDDIAEATIKALNPVGYQVINIGNNSPHKLTSMINLIEDCLGKKADINYKDFHQADMLETWADIGKAERLLVWKPQIGLCEGIKKTAEWFKKNYDIIRNITL